ncbi:hypothetical protein F5Y03DRAFT_389842 [Xylaria venustula]|nr:hypothetical protein F5Y03DRAFT_389842 [Xylaria venustula]
MSQKITSKNLTYDTTLPPFLARLRGQQTAHSGPDPILAAQRRPGQKRSASEEAEDAPVVVDEQGNVITGAFEEQAEKENTEQQKVNPDDEEKEEERNVTQEKEKVAGIGGSRKRKVGRIVGEDQSVAEHEKKAKTKRTDDDDDRARIAKASADVRRLIGQDDAQTKASDSNKSGPEQKKNTIIKSAKKKKPAKKVKLSFGDNDDDGE